MKTIDSQTAQPVPADERQRIFFKEGLPGFETLTEFALIDSGQEPFFLLQSLERSEVAFILIDPFLICPDYEIEIPDAELIERGIGGGTQSPLVMVILTLRDHASSITANLQAPLLLNRETQTGIQYIINDSKWSIRYPVSGSGGSSC